MLDRYGEYRGDYSTLESIKFKPGFEQDQVVWRSEDKAAFSADSLVDHVVGLFTDAVREHTEPTDPT